MGLSTAEMDALAKGTKQGGQAQGTLANNVVNAQASLKELASTVDDIVIKNIFPLAGEAVAGFTGALNSGMSAIQDGIRYFNPQAPDQKASGGPVRSNTPYIVGEQGPELVSFAQSGNVMNNQDLSARLDAINQALANVPNFAGVQSAFLPGIGEVVKYTTESMTSMMVKGISGGMEEYVKTGMQGLVAEAYKVGDQAFARGTFTYGDMQMSTGFQQTGGPRNTYDSVMRDINPARDASLGVRNQQTGDMQTANINNNKEMLNLLEALNTNISQVVRNTGAGVDTSRQILRATTS
jgi:hypothetical protein